MAFDWFNTVNFLLTECFLGGYIMLMIDLRALAGPDTRAGWVARRADFFWKIFSVHAL